MMFSLTGQVTLVTGAASGIGAAIATRFLHSGAEVWAVDRDGPALERLRAELHGAERWHGCVVDLADAAACERLAAEVQARRPAGLDVLVNNAGIGAVGTILQTPVPELERLLQVNVTAVYRLSRLFLPAMIARRSGSIVNLASIGGVVGLRERAAYCATKFAVVGLTKAMALDHAGDNVRVNCICPARVETPFVAARLREYPDPERAYREMSASQPLGRMGRPEEIAAAAVYLASDAAAFVTGSALVIDGGLSAGR
jgi:NAD(P)-dependent dehydrogenase (short-subunit alcohol dehydrogenase family)